MAKDIMPVTFINDFKMHIYDTYTETDGAKDASAFSESRKGVYYTILVPYHSM